MISASRKKAVVLLVLCTVAMMVMTVKKTYPFSYGQSGIQLSELSNLECVEFIASKGVKMPYNYKTSTGFQEMTKDLIVCYEENPYKVLCGTYGSLSTNIYVEEVRKVVNKYYGIPDVDYYPERPAI